MFGRRLSMEANECGYNGFDTSKEQGLTGPLLTLWRFASTFFCEIGDMSSIELFHFQA